MLYGHIEGFQLSALGRAQAVAVGETLRPTGMGLIVHSPLARAAETAQIISAQLDSPAALEVDSGLREAEFSRYLQGLPYWQIPLRRPLWFVHKAKRGILPGDESIEIMGNRVLDVVRRVARQHPDATVGIVSHADPLNAAWVLLDGRPHNEREMYRKALDKAGMLRLDVEGERFAAWEYIPPPTIARPSPQAA